MLEYLKKFYQQESLSKRRERMIPAAIYGMLIAVIYYYSARLRVKRAM